jgi:hypothetical protein
MTKERAAQIAAGGGFNFDEIAVLARIALESIEAEPVAYVMADDLKDSSIISTPAYRDLGEAMERAVGDVVALYVSTPAPESMKDHQIRELVNELRDIAVEYHGTQQLRERIARTIRAAMLQGAEPVSNRDELTDGWVACSERMPEQFVEVLVCTEDGSRYVAALNQSMNWDDGDFFDDIQYVTHWMPLPAAPQQEVT